MKDLSDQWSNKDLEIYFEKVPFEIFSEFAEKGGIENGCDIDVAFPYILNDGFLVEIGACYGRVIDHLIRKNFKGKILAIERSKKYYQILKKKYESFPVSTVIEIINADINYYVPAQKVDTILWMWSDISSFPRIEQLEILDRLKKWLTKGGRLVVETLLHTQPSLNATKTSTDLGQGQTYLIESEYGILHGYIPTEQELNQYGALLGLKVVSNKHYITRTGRERIITIFEN